MVTVLQGDWIEQLRTLPDASVQCCVTSPPYWGLRDYGTAKWEGGNADCDHKIDSQSAAMKQKRSTLGPNRDGLSADNAFFKSNDETYRHLCGKCGATRIDRQLGLEKTPEAYVAKLVEGFREVRRVLRDDGTIWVNLGDSYFGDSPARKASSEAFSKTWNPSDSAGNGGSRRSASRIGDLKPKDLVGIPWMVAFALRADGWYLRSDIIWAKLNPMPESVTDRPTKAHEYIFLLTKSQKYFYDAEAIKEEQSENTHARFGKNGRRSGLGPKQTNSPNGMIRDKATYNEAILPNGRNKRSVWSIAGEAYSGAHFATFPTDLIKPCILAGSKPGDTVLDPFAGSGTTGQVALELGRKAVLIELNPEYCRMIAERTNVTPGLPLPT